MTNIKAIVNENGYMWIEGEFNYYDDVNAATITVLKPAEINGVNISDYETWIEVVRTFNNQTSRDFVKVTDVYEITDNPKGTLLKIKIYFINPSSEDEISTNDVNVQFGINKTTGTLPPGVVPETKILGKAVIDFIITGKNITFYNIHGQKVSEGTFNDMVSSGELEVLKNNISRSATIKIAASNATAKSKAAADYVCTGENDEVIINAALESLDGIGGSIELSEGTFNVAGAIGEVEQFDNIWIKGQGYSTVVVGSDYGIGIATTAGIAKVSDMSVKAGISAITVETDSKAHISFCNVYDCGGVGAIGAIQIIGTATVTNCEVADNARYGIRLTSAAANCVITNNRFSNNTAGNISDVGTNNIAENNAEV